MQYAAVKKCQVMQWKVLMNNENSEKSYNINFRAGLIALAGLPNAGKSTLLNQIIGEKIAIVSHTPQTTRNAIYGIKTTDSYQAIFVDTPGFHSPRSSLNKAIVQQTIDSLSIVDVICLLVEAGGKRGKDFENLVSLIKDAPQEKILIITKIDTVPKEVVYKTAEDIFPLCSFKHVLPVSAVKDINVDTLMKLISEELPENVMQYDEDLITTQPERFLMAEYIREQLFIRLRNEVPHDTLVHIEEYRENSKVIEIDAVIYVNKESQKGIVIGDGGSMLKKIGSSARHNLEAFFDKKIRLNIWVKTKENWVSKSEYLNMQGL